MPSEVKLLRRFLNPEQFTREGLYYRIDRAKIDAMAHELDITDEDVDATLQTLHRTINAITKDSALQFDAAQAFSSANGISCNVEGLKLLKKGVVTRIHALGMTLRP